MDKISLPFRILLVVCAGLRRRVVPRPAAQARAPSAAAAPSRPRRASTGLTAAEAKAKSAVDAANAAAARSEAAANAVGGSSTAAKPSAAKGASRRPRPGRQAGGQARRGQPAKPGLADDAAPGDPSRPLLASVDAGKVVVVALLEQEGLRRPRHPPRPAHDRPARGKVVASAVPIDDVGRYEAITRGAQVLESPTVLVIGAGGKARAITGYTQAKEIDQAVSDIGGKGFEAKKAFQLTGFAKVADDACKDFGYALDQKADPPTTVPALSKALGVAARSSSTRATALAKAKATTAGERKLKSALVAFADQRRQVDRRRASAS